MEGRVWVKNVPDKWSEEDVRDLFSKYGTITWCHKFMMGQVDSAFVRFSSRQSADDAIAALHYSQTMEGCTYPLFVVREPAIIPNFFQGFKEYANNFNVEFFNIAQKETKHDEFTNSDSAGPKITQKETKHNESFNSEDFNSKEEKKEKERVIKNYFKSLLDSMMDIPTYLFKDVKALISIVVGKCDSKISLKTLPDVITEYLRSLFLEDLSNPPMDVKKDNVNVNYYIGTNNVAQSSGGGNAVGCQGGESNTVSSETKNKKSNWKISKIFKSKK